MKHSQNTFPTVHRIQNLYLKEYFTPKNDHLFINYPACKFWIIEENDEQHNHIKCPFAKRHKNREQWGSFELQAAHLEMCVAWSFSAKIDSENDDTVEGWQ